MRLSNTEIIAGLRHPNVLVREEVAAYLDTGLRTQPDITPHFIAAVEQFGWKDFLKYPHRIAQFGLDEQSLPWALDQIRTGYR